MGDESLEGRVTRLEVKVDGLQQDISEIKTDMTSQINSLKTFFTERDQTFTKNLWKLVFGLVVVMVAIVMTFLGIKTLPKLF